MRVIEAIIPKGDEDPAQVIMRHASERVCDLIVMASHGRSDVAQFFLGRSVAEQVARDSKIPTIIARMYDSPPEDLRPLMQELERIVTAHVRTEEEQLFPAMIESGVDADKLGSKLDAEAGVPGE